MPRSHINAHKSHPDPPMEELQRIARKYSRRPDEAEDLVQDLLLETVRTKRNISDKNFKPWAHGFLRNRAAFIARTEGRRRNREEKVADEQENHQKIKRLQFPEAFIDRLSPALQKAARLMNCGLSKKEICYLLDVTDTALRQRFTALRKEWKYYLGTIGTGPDIRNESESPLQIGLLRRSLRNSIHGDSDKVIGSFDPDGNLLVFRTKPAHKRESDGNNRSEQKT